MQDDMQKCVKSYQRAVDVGKEVGMKDNRGGFISSLIVCVASDGGLCFITAPWLSLPLAPAVHITKTAHYPQSPRGAAESRSALQNPALHRRDNPHPYLPASPQSVEKTRGGDVQRGRLSVV